jgi:hypothetical protein
VTARRFSGTADSFWTNWSFPRSSINHNARHSQKPAHQLVANKDQFEAPCAGPLRQQAKRTVLKDSMKMSDMETFRELSEREVRNLPQLARISWAVFGQRERLSAPAQSGRVGPLDKVGS